MRESTKGLLFISITVFLWSTIEVMSKLISEDIDPLTIAFLRFFIGGIILLPFLIHYGRVGDWSRFGYREWTWLISLSFIGVTGTFVLYHKALVWIDASSVATLVSMVPLFAGPVSVIILKEKIGAIGIIGLILGGIGVLVLNISEGWEVNSILGIGVMVLAVFCFSLYSVLMKPLNTRMDYRVTTPLTLIIGSILMIPFLLMEGDPLVPFEVSAGSWAGMMYLSIFTVGVAYLFYFLGLKNIEVSRGSSLLYMKPALATVLAIIFIGEDPTLLRIISILLISASVYFIIKQEKIESSVDRLLRGDEA